MPSLSSKTDILSNIGFSIEWRVKTIGNLLTYLWDSKFHNCLDSRNGSTFSVVTFFLLMHWNYLHAAEYKFLNLIYNCALTFDVNWYKLQFSIFYVASFWIIKQYFSKYALNFGPNQPIFFNKSIFPINICYHGKAKCTLKIYKN